MSAERSLAAALAFAVAVAVPSAAGAAPSAGPCPPGVGIGLLEVPRALIGDPRARSYIIDRVSPGARFSRRIKVCNGTDARATIGVYPDAASISGGSFTLGDGRAVNELSSWLTVSPPALDLPAHASGTATVTVAVPVDATAGERYAAVVVQGPPQPSGGIAVTSRVGLRVYLSVGTGGLPPNDFRIDTLQAARRADGRPLVLARIRNTGPRALELSGDLSLAEPATRLTAGPFAASLGTTLAPGDTEPVTVVLPAAITGGPWTATLTARSGTLTRRAEGVLSFPDRSGTVLAPVAVTGLPLYADRSVVVPFAAGLAGLVALLVLLAALLNRRQGRRRATR